MHAAGRPSQTHCRPAAAPPPQGPQQTTAVQLEAQLRPGERQSALPAADSAAATSSMSSNSCQPRLLPAAAVAARLLRQVTPLQQAPSGSASMCGSHSLHCSTMAKFATLTNPTPWQRLGSPLPQQRAPKMAAQLHPFRVTQPPVSPKTRSKWRLLLSFQLQHAAPLMCHQAASCPATPLAPHQPRCLHLKPQEPLWQAQCTVPEGGQHRRMLPPQGSRL